MLKSTDYTLPKRGTSRILTHTNGWRLTRQKSASARFVRDTKPTLGPTLGESWRNA